MKSLQIIVSISICLTLHLLSFSQKIDSIKIVPSFPSIQDSILFVTYSKPFSGDCNYRLHLDSIKSNIVYISGKYDSNGKCLTNGANDTINLGLFIKGSYKINYSFIDIYGLNQTTVLTSIFTITESTYFDEHICKKNRIYLVSNSGTIRVSSELIGSTLQIFLANGVVQYQTKIEKENISLDSVLQVAGIYFYTVTTPQGKLITGQFVRE